MTATTNAKSLRQYKNSFSFVVELTLPFDFSPNTVREVKNLSTNFS